MLIENFVISESMKQSFRLFHNMFEKIEKPTFILSKEGSILYLNSAGVKII